MTAQQQRAAASMLSRPNPAAMSQAALMRARGQRPQPTVTKQAPTVLRGGQQGLRNQIAAGMMLPNNYQLAAAAGSQFLQVNFLCFFFLI